MGSNDTGRTVATDRTSKVKTMKFEFHRVKSFEIIGPYRLNIFFEDDTRQDIDFEPVLRGELYRPLRDLTQFEQVSIDPEVHTLVWPNGADFNPDMLHDWNENVEEIHRSAAEWDTVSV
jgi:hypothetical protein